LGCWAGSKPPNRKKTNNPQIVERNTTPHPLATAFLTT
jgi:hypothetical protein